jgi:hypothetical protein
METISGDALSALFRKTKGDLLFPLEVASKHASFIMSFRSSMSSDAFRGFVVGNWARTNLLVEALLSAGSEESIREIFERMTPGEAVLYDERLRLAERYLSEHPEISLQRDPARGEIFWIDFLRKMLVIPSPPPP